MHLDLLSRSITKRRELITPLIVPHELCRLVKSVLSNTGTRAARKTKSLEFATLVWLCLTRRTSSRNSWALLRVGTIRCASCPISYSSGPSRGVVLLCPVTFASSFFSPSLRPFQ